MQNNDFLAEWREYAELAEILNEQVTGRSLSAWNRLSPESQDVVRSIAKYAAKRQPIRMLYRPKVTTGKPVYRTVHPYSLRVRDIHVDGYHRPKRPTVVFFAYDANNANNPNPGNEKPTIKNFVADRIITVRPARGKYVVKWSVEFEDEGKSDAAG